MTKPEFLLYLDAEIDSQDYNSPLENMLITTKLRLLDEVGKGMGVDVMVLPKLAAEENPAELRRKVMLIVSLVLSVTFLRLITHYFHCYDERYVDHGTFADV